MHPFHQAQIIYTKFQAVINTESRDYKVARSSLKTALFFQYVPKSLSIFHV